MKARTFIAVELPSDIRHSILGLRDQLRGQTRGLRWVNEDNLHLTIRFLGNVEESKIARIEKALRPKLEIFPSFHLSFAAFGAFPNLNHCKVLWIGIQEGASSCKQLREIIDQDLVSLGFPLEGRDFSPHLTLARARENEHIRLKDDELLNTSSLGGFRVNRITLFKSDLQPTGPIHSSLAEFGLLG